MLLELTIENFAIIASLHLNFQQGMTALTGETGAGKSIIIDAMGLLAGSRGSVDYIRQGAERCRLEGLFDLPEQPELYLLLEELGVESEPGDPLILQRDILLSGKNICRVNGRSMNLANLRRIGNFLVDIQGQNEHQELLQEEQHLSLIDAFGDGTFQKLLQSYQQDYAAFRELEKRVHKIQANEQSFVQRLDMLRFQQEEIAQAQLVPEEELALEEERSKLANYQKIVDSLGQSHQILAESENTPVDQVGAVIALLEEVAYLDGEYGEILENLQSAYYLLQDASGAVSRQLDFLELDEERLETVTQRLELIRQLKRKYGDSIPKILSYYDKISKELADYTNSDNQLEQLQQELEKKERALVKQAEQLHKKRKQLAHSLEQVILKELKELYMENTQFAVSFQKSRHLTENGFDEVAFYLSANPGEPLRPLVKVASGGELSRILLALKTTFSQNQGITSIIFDEVDTGVSGRVAQAIAEKIAQIAKNSQVLCITHLPQVAAVADYQYEIEKEVDHGRTRTKVQPLTPEKRVQEIARMLSGAEVTPLTIEHAKELLSMAGHLPKN